MLETEPLYKQPLGAILAEAQRLRDERDRAGQAQKKALKLAVLGGFSTQFVTRMLDAFLLERGLVADIYEAPYDTYVEQILNPASELYAFAPELVLVLVHRGNIQHWPATFASEAHVEALARAEVERWAQCWQTLRARALCQVVQSTFELPDVRALGNHAGSVPFAELAFVRRVNALLVERARGEAHLFDADYLCASFGLSRALDASRYHLTKQPFSFEFLPTYCHGLAELVLSTQGRAKKCVVLDLDGTLWGGVVGDDGLEGLVLGPGDAEGEAFAAFQGYLKALKQRGVLLAVCSKNDDAIARDAFARHPHMVLRPEDIACFVANWQDKAANIRHIAATLNIGTDALVFVDNSAEERHLVRTMLPEVTVIELSTDPAEYTRQLDEGRYFETTELTSDAAARTDYLRADVARSSAETQFSDYAAYLKSLALVAQVSPVGPGNIQRVAELIKRTNQFNLRTMRHGAEHVLELMRQNASAGIAATLSDRFGQHGLIAVVLLVREHDALFIDTWLMSCRVLKKGVEQFMLEQALALAHKLDMPRLIGEYRPTAKNGMVAKLYEELGFSKLSEDAEGVTRWELRVGAPSARVEHFIQRVDGEV